VRIAIDVARGEHETPAELKGIRAEAMLPMAGGRRARPRLGVITSHQVQNVCRLEPGRTIGEPLRIYQQRKRDRSFLAKELRVTHIAKSDSREVGALVFKLLLMVAQLRNMLAAEDSAVMTQEDDHRRTAFPQ